MKPGNRQHKQKKRREEIDKSRPEGMEDVIKKVKEVEFFECLTVELTDKIKEIAKELIDFRKDLHKKVERGIVAIANKDILETSNQLEGINETLEKSTMKIMDINDEQMEIVDNQLQRLKSIVYGNDNPKGIRRTKESMMAVEKKAKIDPSQALKTIKQQMEVLKTIGDLSLSMLEPLSFQDLVGQRIQRIVQLVESIEAHIEDLVVSCGIKIQKYKENPRKSFHDLEQDVKNYRTALKGPQREGEGLNQGDIDKLLVTLEAVK
jgi:chemotaxis regulatin CheY-phosphate phosphatase CheZ